MTISIEIQNYNHPNGNIIKKRYSNGQLAVFYRDYDDEPIAELSVNLNSIELAPNEIILKNYSENSEIAKAFLDSEVFIPTGRYVLIGPHLCPICQVNF
jgi:hypothetical protein